MHQYKQSLFHLSIGWIGIMVMLITGCNRSKPENSNLPPHALGPLQTITLELAGQPVEIEVAITQPERSQGLMYRESMPENHGMLFVFERPEYLSFWMKNTKIPLSIAFIREDGTISNIEKMKPHRGPFDPTEHYRALQRCQYALEMNQGWFENHGVKEGEQIPLPFDEIEKLKEKKLNS